MKQVWLSLFLVAAFTIACSSPETTTNDTEQKTESTVSANDNTSETPVPQNVAMTEPTSTAAVSEEGMTTTEVEESTGSTTTTIKTVSTSSTTNNTEAPVEATTAENTTTESASKPVVTTTTTTTTTSKPTSTTSVAPKPAEKPVEKPVAKPTLSHDAFDAMLRKYVNSSGGVDYAGFKKDKSKLAAYLDLLKNNPPQSSWSKNKEMAYWINMYNAFTIHSIVEKYPVNSVMDLEGGKVWDKKKIVVAGKSLTLNNIEKDKLLKRFKEPRVHFAVNCAAASCPPLLNKAWTEDNVQRYYEKQAKAFINNSKYNDVSAKSIEASQIFNWYASDFGGSDKILAYFQKYSETTIKNNAKISFKEYDWKLNKK